jgi:hypothetical protein
VYEEAPHKKKKTRFFAAGAMRGCRLALFWFIFLPSHEPSSLPSSSAFLHLHFFFDPTSTTTRQKNPRIKTKSGLVLFPTVSKNLAYYKEKEKKSTRFLWYPHQNSARIHTYIYIYSQAKKERTHTNT